MADDINTSNLNANAQETPAQQKPIQTNNALFTYGMGEKVSEADAQKIKDFDTLTPYYFTQIYGEDAYADFKAQAQALHAASAYARGAHSRSVGQAIKDSIKNIGVGAGTNLLGTASFAAGLFGADDVSKALALASQDLSEFGAEAGSINEQAQQAFFALKNEASKNRIERQYQEDIARGESEGVAGLRKIGREYTSTMKNAWDAPGMVTNIGAQALGSALVDVVGTKGIGKLKTFGMGTAAPALFGKEAVKNFGERSAAYFAKHATQEKIAKATPWQLQNALGEGGDAYSSLLAEGQNITNEELMATSPEFNAKVKEYVQQGMSIPEAQAAARDSLIKRAAMEAGIKTGILAGGLSYFTKNLAKPFEKLPEQSIKRTIMDALPDALIEEPGTEGGGQFFQNEATRKYLNKNQDLYEDVGSSAAQGTIGAFGISSPRVAAQVLPGGTNIIASKIAKTLENRPLTRWEIDHALNNITSKEDMKGIDEEDQDTFQEIQKNVRNLAGTFRNRSEEDGPLTPEETIQIQQELQAQKEALDDLTFSKQGKATIAKEKSLINSLGRELVSDNSAKVKEQRKSYTKDTQLTDEQLNNEIIDYNNNVMIKGEAAAEKSLNKLPEGVRNQIKSVVDPDSVTETPKASETQEKKEIKENIAPEPLGENEGGEKPLNIFGKEEEESHTETSSITPKEKVNTPEPESATPDLTNTETPSKERINTPEQQAAKKNPQNIQENQEDSQGAQVTPQEPVPPGTQTPPQGQASTPVSANNEVRQEQPAQNTKEPISPADQKNPQNAKNVQENQLGAQGIQDNQGAQNNRVPPQEPVSPGAKTTPQEQASTSDSTNTKKNPQSPQDIKNIQENKQGAQSQSPQNTNQPPQDSNKQQGKKPEKYSEEEEKATQQQKKAKEATLSGQSVEAASKKKVEKIKGTGQSFVRIKSDDKKEKADIVVAELNEEQKEKTKKTLKSGVTEKEFVKEHKKATVTPPVPISKDSNVILYSKNGDGVYTHIRITGKGSNEIVELDKEGRKIATNFLKAVQENNEALADSLGNELFKKHIPSNVFNSAFSFHYQKGSGASIGTVYTNGLIYITGYGFLDNRFSPELLQVLMDPSASTDKKLQVLAQGLEDILTFAQAAYDLSPEVLARKGQYLDLEDGLIKDLATDEIKGEFKSRLGDAFSKIATPVRRPFYLWQKNNGGLLDNFIDLLQSKSLFDTLRANHLTDVRILINSFYGTSQGEPTTHRTHRREFINQSDNIQSQLLTMLNPDGVFQKEFGEKFAERIKNNKKNFPESFKKIFFPDGENPSKLFTDLARIAAVHGMSILSAYPHSLNEKELARLGLNEEDITPESLAFFEKAIMEQAALQHMVSSMRRIMGVAQNNEASQREFEEFFGTLAVETIQALMDAGMVERVKHNVSLAKGGSMDIWTIGIKHSIDPNDPSKVIESDYSKLFRPKADIILRLLDPTLKNAWSTEPSAPGNTTLHSSRPLTRAQKRVIGILNKQPMRLNMPYVSVMQKLAFLEKRDKGGNVYDSQEGISQYLFGSTINPDTRHFFSGKDFVSKQGKVISHRLAFDFLNEFMLAIPKEQWGTTEFFYNYVALKNSRLMQEGAATQQGNRFLRVMQLCSNGKPIDILTTDSRSYKKWAWTLTGQLNGSTNKNAANEEKAVKAINAIEKQIQSWMKEGKYQRFLSYLADPDNKEYTEKNYSATQLRQDLKDFTKLFNDHFKKEFDLSLDPTNLDDNLNALIELARVANIRNKQNSLTESIKQKTDQKVSKLRENEINSRKQKIKEIEKKYSNIETNLKENLKTLESLKQEKDALPKVYPDVLERLEADIKKEEPLYEVFHKKDLSLDEEKKHLINRINTLKKYIKNNDFTILNDSPESQLDFEVLHELRKRGLTKITEDGEIVSIATPQQEKEIRDIISKDFEPRRQSINEYEDILLSYLDILKEINKDISEHAKSFKYKRYHANRATAERLRNEQKLHKEKEEEISLYESQINEQQKELDDLNNQKNSLNSEIDSIDSIIQDKIQEITQETEKENLNNKELLELNNSLQQFQSNVLIELDGIADGPTNINTSYAMPMGSFTANVLRNAFRGGIYYGIRLTSQEVTGKGAIAGDFVGTGGQDMHSQVAQIEAVRKICSRYLDAKKTANLPDNNENASAIQIAKNQMKITEQFFDILDKLGFVEYKDKDFSWDKLSELSDDNSKLPFKLDRDISKKLTTVIPYNAGVGGSNVQVRDIILERLYEKISEYCQNTAEAAREINPELYKIEKELEKLKESQKELSNNTNEIDYQKSFEQLKKEKEKLKKYKEALKEILETPEEEDPKLNRLRAKIIFQYKTEIQKAKDNIAKLENLEENSSISEKIQSLQEQKEKLTKKLQNPEGFNELNSLLNQVTSFVSWEYNRSSGYVPSETIHNNDDDAKKERKKLISVESYKPLNNKDLTNPKLRLSKDGKTIYIYDKEASDKGFSSSKSDFRNFELTALGEKRFADNMKNIFGEPAWYAVNEVIGTQGMKGSKIVASLGWCLGVLAQGVEEVEKAKAGGSLINLKGKQRHAVQGKIDSVSPTFPLASGAQAIVRKGDFSSSDNVVYSSDPENENALKYYSSSATLRDVGVSTGALLTQALGDASMVMYAMPELERAGLNVMQIFDGLYTDAYGLEHGFGTILNKAHALSQKQQVFNSIYMTIQAVGQALIDQKLSKQKDPLMAIQDCLSNLAEGKMLNGKDRPKNVQGLDGTDITKNLLRYQTQLEDALSFISNLQQEEKAYQENRMEKPSANLSARRHQAKNVVTGTLFKFLKRLCINEFVEHQILDAFPKAVHHMSGSDQTYIEGNPLTFEQAKELLSDVNKHLREEDQFKSWDELMSAYMNTLCSEYVAANEDLLIKRYGPDAITEWKEHTGRGSNILKGYREITDPDVLKLLKDKLPLIEEKKVQHEKNLNPPKKARNDFKIDKAKDLAMEWINTYIKNPKLQAFYRSLYRKILTLAPYNLEIHVVSGIEGIPKEYRSKFHTKDGQIGLYVYHQVEHKDKDGKVAKIDYFPHIYILDSNATGLDDRDGKVLKTLMHELVHAAISHKVMKYYDPKHKRDLTKTQILAFENLEKLMDTFLNTDMWQVEGDREVPAELTKLRDILQNKTRDKAEKLDEAIAYLLSEAPLLEEISKYYRPKEKALQEHVGRLNDLLHKLVNCAKNLVKKVLGLITGSTYDQLFEETVTEVNGKKVKNLRMLKDRDLTDEDLRDFPFISLFGQNTMILMEPMQSKRTKKADDTRAQGMRKQGWTERFSLDARKDNNLPWNKRIEDKINKYAIKKADYMTKEMYGEFKEGKAIKEHEKIIKEESKKISNLKKYIYKSLEGTFENANDIAESAVFYMMKDAMNPNQRYHLHNQITKLTNYINSYMDNFLTEYGKLEGMMDVVEASEEIKELKEKFDNGIAQAKQIVSSMNIMDDYNLEKSELINPKAQKDALIMAIAVHTPYFDNLTKVILNKVNELPKQKQQEYIKKHKNFFGNAKKAFIDPISYLEKLSHHINIETELKLTKDKSLGEAVKMVTEEQMEALKTAEKNEKDKLHTLFGYTDDLLTKAVLSASAIIDALARALGLSKLNPNSMTLDKVPFYAKEFKNFRKSPYFIYSFLMEKVRSFANSHIKNPQWATFAKEFYGRTPKSSPIETYLKQLKGYNEKINNLSQQELLKHLTKLFKKTKVTKKVRKFLYNSLVTTNITALDIDDFNIAFTASTPSESLECINTFIKDIETYLDTEFPAIAEKYKKKVKQYTDYISGRAEAGPNLLTNAVAIAQLLGEQEKPLTYSNELASKLNQLISLYSLRDMDKEDFNKLHQICTDDLDAINSIIHHLKAIEQAEQTKVNAFEDKLYQNNYMAGRLYKSNYDSDSYLIIPRDQLKKYISLGYKEVGDYPKSNVNPKENMVQVYCKVPLDNNFQEGIIPSIRKTAFTWKIDSKSRGEANGTRIYDKEVIKDISARYHDDPNNMYIPIYDVLGKVIGYDRAIPKDSRHYLNKSNDLFQSMTRTLSRQSKESSADLIAKEGLKLAWNDYNNSSKKEKENEFIDLFHSTNPVIIEGINRLTPSFRNMIKDIFGGEHFYIRPDMVNLYLGRDQMSITDMWDNKFLFPKPMEDAIVKCLESVFGPKIRYWLGRLESFEISWATWTRDTIVIRSGFVAVANMLSNIIMMNAATGIPFTKMATMLKETFLETEQYNRLSKKEQELQFQIDEEPYTAKKEELIQKKKDIQDQIEQLSIYQLIKEGEYSTITTEGLQLNEVNIWKSSMSDNIDDWLKNVPKLKKAGQELLMTKSSNSYQAMLELTNLGDWLAKVVTYRYLTENKKYLHNEARDIASTLYVDYDQPIDRARSYSNRTGMTWFFTYKFRMIPAAILCMFLNPSRVLLGNVFESMFPGGMGTPFSENILAKLLTGDIGYSIGLWNLLKGITLHPISMMLAWIL